MKMKKNASKFFAVIAVAVAIIFATSIQYARAYMIPSSGVSSSAPSDTSYNVAGSLQQLVSPFQGFIQSLQWTNDTPIGLKVAPTQLPAVSIGPDVQNILAQWFGELNDWIYRSTGIQLSGIISVILNIILWTLHIAEEVINWLLGLIH